MRVTRRWVAVLASLVLFSSGALVAASPGTALREPRCHDVFQCVP